MLILNSFLNECCLKYSNMDLKVQRTKKKDSPVHRTPGVLPHKVLRSLDSPVHRTPGRIDFLVLRTPGSLDSSVHRTPGSPFKMLITQPRSKKNRNGPRTSLMGPGGAFLGEKPSTKNLVRLSLKVNLSFYLCRSLGWDGMDVLTA